MATFITIGRCDGFDEPMSNERWTSFREAVAETLALTLGEPDAEVTGYASWRYVTDEETALFVVMFPALSEYGRACRLLARVADSFDSPSVVVTDGFSDVIVADDYAAPTITEAPTFYGAPVDWSVVDADVLDAEPVGDEEHGVFVLSLDEGDPWDEDPYGPDAYADAEAEALAWYGPEPLDDEAEAASYGATPAAAPEVFTPAEAHEAPLYVLSVPSDAVPFIGTLPAALTDAAEVAPRRGLIARVFGL